LAEGTKAQRRTLRAMRENPEMSHGGQHDGLKRVTLARMTHDWRGSRRPAALLPNRVPADNRAPTAADEQEQSMSEVDRLEAAISECREMIREAHAATKDLRTAVREAKKELRELAKDEVAGQVHNEVTRQLDELRERTSEAVSAATQKVIAEFDRFGESLLGKETYWKTAS